MLKPKVYLSGPMEMAQDGGLSWRQQAEKELTSFGFKVFNPCTDIKSNNILQKYGFLNAEEFNSFKQTIDSSIENQELYLKAIREFIDLDTKELLTSDIVLAYIDTSLSGGTAGELTLAYGSNIPIVAWSYHNMASLSGWMIGCTNYLFHLDDPFKDAIQKVIELKPFLSTT